MFYFLKRPSLLRASDFDGGDSNVSDSGSTSVDNKINPLNLDSRFSPVQSEEVVMEPVASNVGEIEPVAIVPVSNVSSPKMREEVVMEPVASNVEEIEQAIVPVSNESSENGALAKYDQVKYNSLLHALQENCLAEDLIICANEPDAHLVNSDIKRNFKSAKEVHRAIITGVIEISFNLQLRIDYSKYNTVKANGYCYYSMHNKLCAAQTGVKAAHTIQELCDWITRIETSDSLDAAEVYWKNTKPKIINLLQSNVSEADSKDWGMEIVDDVISKNGSMWQSSLFLPEGKTDSNTKPAFATLWKTNVYPGYDASKINYNKLLLILMSPLTFYLAEKKHYYPGVVKKTGLQWRKMLEDSIE